MAIVIRRVGLIVVTVFSLLSTSQSSGSIGPYGGTVDLIAVDPANPNVLYAGAEGLFKTTNQGETWAETRLGEVAQAFDSRSDVSAFAIDPLITNILYAALPRLGVLKSTDGGGEWMLTGLRNQTVNALVIDPSDPQILYAASEESGIFKTTNGGDDWSPINSGLTIHNFLSLAIDPGNPATVYAGSNRTFEDPTDGTPRGFGVFKTINGGQQWTSIGPPNKTVYAIAIDPLDSNRLYLAVGDLDEIYQTLDGGGHWTILRDGVIGLDVKCVAFDTVQPDVLYACTKGGGVYKTINGGQLWLPTALNRGLIKTVVVSGGKSPAVLAGAALDLDLPVDADVLGVHKSLDSGQSWREFNQGINRRKITSIVVRPDDPSFIYAAADGRAFRTTTGGANWTPLGSDLRLAIRLLLFDPANPDILYGAGGTIYVSEDRGDHWVERRQGIGTDVGNLTAIAIDPLDSNNLYVGTFFRGVFKTTDAGSLWQHSVSSWQQVGALTVDPGSPSTLWVGLFGGVIGNYVFKSIDAGENWLNRSNGLTYWGISSMLVDPTNSDIVYAAYDNGRGVFKTTNGGDNWVVTGLTGGTVYTLAFDPSDPNTIYAGTLSGILNSTDGGENWSVLGSAIAHEQVFSIAVHPQDPRRLYAATSHSAFASDDGGETWH